MRRSRPLVAALTLSALLTAGCSTSGGSSDAGPDERSTTTEAGSTTTEAPSTTVPDDPAEALHDAVDATLAADSFSIDAAADLSVAFQDLSYRSTGRVDYGDPPITDAVIEVTQGGATTKVSQRADGTHLWIAPEGPQAPAIPDGKTWVQGDADLLFEADSFTPAGLVGVVIALRAADDVEVEGTETIDGVTTNRYSTEFSYDDAVDAAGSDAAAFQSSLSLTAPGEVILDIEVWIGDDGIIRRFELEIDGGDEPPAPSGSYDLELTDVNEEVEPPEAPDPDDVLTGPQAEALLAQLMS